MQPRAAIVSFSLKQIRYFVAAAETGQISRAAAEFNVSQSAVTAAVQQLEALLGMALFERRPGGVALTHAGARFLLNARNVIQAADEALRMSEETPKRIRGKVQIAVTYTVSGYFVTPVLVRFNRMFPDVELTLLEAERPVIEADILGGRSELGLILISNLARADAIASRRLFRSQRRLWTPSNHPLLSAERVGFAEISNFPYVALTVDEALETALRYWAATPHRPNIVFRTSSVEAVRTMVAAGMGVTILSDMIYRPWSLEAQRIETRQIADSVPSMDVGIVWKSGRALSPAAQALVDFLVGAFAGPGRQLSLAAEPA
jgi:molybdate transport repressor ModE-like protein